MADVSDILALPFPTLAGTDPADVPADLKALVDRLEELIGDRGYGQVLTEESTSATSFTDLATVGPSVTVEVPAGALVAVYTKVDVKSSAIGKDAFAGLYEPTDIPDPAAAAVAGWASPTYSTRRSMPADGDGVTTLSGGLIILDEPTPGERTYSLKYQAHDLGGGTATFRNRKLWVRVLPF